MITVSEAGLIWWEIQNYEQGKARPTRSSKPPVPSGRSRWKGTNDGEATSGSCSPIFPRSSIDLFFLGICTETPWNKISIPSTKTVASFLKKLNTKRISKNTQSINLIPETSTKKKIRSSYPTSPNQSFHGTFLSPQLLESSFYFLASGFSHQGLPLCLPSFRKFKEFNRLSIVNMWTTTQPLICDSVPPLNKFENWIETELWYDGPSRITPSPLDFMKFRLPFPTNSC